VVEAALPADSARTIGTDRAVAATPPIRATSLPAWREPIAVDGWRFAAGLTERAVKQALPGPYSLGRRIDPGSLGRDLLTESLAAALNAELRALFDAGCPLIEIQEDAAVAIGDDADERARFVEAQRRLLDGLPDELHRTLAVRGGSAHLAGAATIFAAPYQSYLFDLVSGPDNWKLIAAAPGDRGIVCGAMDVRADRPMGVEELIYAAHYAASTRGRGLVRIGLAPAGSMTHLSPTEARARLETLVRAAELAQAPPDVIGRSVDPRAVDLRSAALGRYAPGSRPPLGTVSPDVRKAASSPPGAASDGPAARPARSPGPLDTDDRASGPGRPVDDPVD
jgi:methionine synthase II (cobalamin-independent)